MKILFVTTISGTLDFLVHHMRFLMDAGNRVDVACNVEDITEIQLQELGLRVFDIPFQRSPVRKENLQAFQKIRELVLREKYDVMHVHTPVAAFVARMACRNIPGLRVYYTAHGFHFFKGAPLLNWAVYYTMEKLAARWTDILITMNREDYSYAGKMKLRHNGETFLVHGVGLDVCAILDARRDAAKKREELGIAKDAYVLLSVGELIKRKNFEVSIRAFAKMNIPHSVYLICGRGPLEGHLIKVAQALNVADRVIFAGFRKDIYEILKASDVFLFPSRQEGLPVAVMEAMAAGLPVVCSPVRGNIDLIQNEINGLIAEKCGVNGFAKAVLSLFNSPDTARKFRAKNAGIVSRYSVRRVLKEMESIYETELYSAGNPAAQQDF